MGVTYKLKDEVVQFIISQRQGDPLSSCRQLAESASLKFGLQLSKSSVHDVLKESGIITPRGRKPKSKFEIPQEKKKQIQSSLSKVNLLPSPETFKPENPIIAAPPPEPVEAVSPIIETKEANLVQEMALPASAEEQKVVINETKITAEDPPIKAANLPEKEELQVPVVYEGAGRVFLKGVLWDLGIFPEKSFSLQQDQELEQGQMQLPSLQEADWRYFLTYAKGVKVDLEDNKGFFIDLPLPIERCIREVADGLVNNVRPFMVQKVSDDDLFRASMKAQSGNKITNISIVGRNDDILIKFSDIVERNIDFINNDWVFVENNIINFLERAKAIFFPQLPDSNVFIDNILNLKGFDTTNSSENIVSLLIEDGYDNKIMIQEAADKLNGMHLRDDQNRLVKVKIQSFQRPG